MTDEATTSFLAGYDQAQRETRALILKARALVEMLDDAERNHGALIGAKTLRAANELRLELNAFKEVK